MEALRQVTSRPLELVLNAGGLPVSNVSSLLRVTQAALREVARDTEDTREAFLVSSHPVLYFSTRVEGEQLVLALAFMDALDSNAVSPLSEGIFDRFLQQLSQFIKGLPQRGLWGESVDGGKRRSYESGVARRLDQLRMELRRFPQARLRFGRHVILFQGDRMEIEG